MDTSGIFKQAVTPQNYMVGWKALLVPPLLWMERVQMEEVLLEGGWETSQVSSRSMGRTFLLVSKSGLAGGSPQQQLLAKTDVIPFPIQ